MNRVKPVVGACIGLVALVVVWAVAASGRPELVLPSPADTLRALVDLTTEGVLVPELTRTVVRAVAGVALALVIGGVWGALNGMSTWMSAITQPVLAVMMAVPPVVVVAVGLVWFGPGPDVTRLVVVLVALPLIVVALAEAIRDLDRDLFEMATVFEVPRLRVLRRLVVPGITSPVAAAVSVTLGQALRVAVMAELLAAADGVGAEIALARTNLETADLFAWAVALVGVVLVLELAVLRPLTARLLRWRTPGSALDTVAARRFLSSPPRRPAGREPVAVGVRPT